VSSVSPTQPATSLCLLSPPLTEPRLGFSHFYFIFLFFTQGTIFFFFTFSLVRVRFGLLVEDEIFEQGSNIVIEPDQGSNLMSLL
jgi:hypothetical protein